MNTTSHPASPRRVDFTAHLKRERAEPRSRTPWIFRLYDPNDPLYIKPVHRPLYWDRSHGFTGDVRPILRPPRYLRLVEVKHITGHATSTLYRLMKKGLFPHPLEIGPNSVAWREDEVDEWCKTRKPRRRKDGLTVNAANLIGGRDE